MKAGAWVKQITSQVAKHGTEKASWYCEWNEPDGSRRIKSCGKGTKGRKAADRMAERLRADLLTGTYNRQEGVTWSEFRERYEKNEMAEMAIAGRQSVSASLDFFESILRLQDKTLDSITAERIANFKAARRAMRGLKPGSTVSPATINRDLRHVRAALSVAMEWKMMANVPSIRFAKEASTLPRYITPEHFAATYKACEVAQEPSGLHVSPAAWWRALLVMVQMTGWRRGELLSLEWVDVDLERGAAITRARAAGNKAKRDVVTPLHPLVVDHLRPLKSFLRTVFPWHTSMKPLQEQFHAIQDAAGIDLPCRVTRRTGVELAAMRANAKRLSTKFNQLALGDDHECTTACHKYGLHDGRRAFATMNAANMTREALQALMRHASSQTTERYINYARQMNPAVANLHVPDVARIPQAEVGIG